MEYKVRGTEETLMGFKKELLIECSMEVDCWCYPYSMYKKQTKEQLISSMRESGDFSDDYDLIDFIQDRY